MSQQCFQNQIPSIELIFPERQSQKKKKQDEQQLITSFQKKDKSNKELTLNNLNQKMLDNQQSNSLLYIQRAILYFSQNNHEEAINDLKKAANLDHLNPIIYYNIASVQVCQNNLIQALKNMYCGVSCLYLKRAIIKLQQIDTHRALKNCSCNVDAKILLIMYLIRDKKYYLAHRQIKAVIQSNPEIQALYKIKNDVETHLKISSSQIKIEEEKKTSNKQNRLLFIQQIAQNNDIGEQLSMKLKQFKQLYNQIYGDFTKQSQDNPKIWILDSVKNNQHADKNVNILNYSENQTLLLESKQFINNLQLFPIKLSKNQPKSQKIIQTSKKQSLNFQAGFKKINNEASIQIHNPFDFILTNSKKSTVQIDQQEVLQNSDEKIKVSRKISNKSTSDKNYQDDQILQDNTIKIAQIIAKQCQFFIDPEKIQNMKNIYCIIFFNNHQNKFNTNQVQCKPKATWNQTFEKQIKQEKLQKIKVKVMNKQFKKLRDDFIGQGQIQINKYGSMKFPIYNKETVKTGLMSIELKKIYKKIQEDLLLQ